MSSPNNHHPQSSAAEPQAPTASSESSESSAPSNRAARRAQRKGKAPSEQAGSTGKHDQIRQSQVMAQPRFKGRRGNR